MKCPACGFQNLEDARFCNRCGKKLDRAARLAGRSIPREVNSAMPAAPV